MSLKIDECRYQTFKQLQCIEKGINKVNMASLDSHNDFCIVNKFMEVQQAQLELKRIMCGNTQFASIYNELKPSYSLLYEFKIANLTHHINKAKSGLHYITEEICTGPRGYIIAYLIYFNGEITKESWNRYVSIYLLIKQGGYFDDSLPWPLTHPLTLTLLMTDETPSHYQMMHKCGQSVNIIPPAPIANSYHVASGCVNFAPVRILFECRFVEDNCMRFLCNLCT